MYRIKNIRTEKSVVHFMTIFLISPDSTDSFPCEMF